MVPPPPTIFAIISEHPKTLTRPTDGGRLVGQMPPPPMKFKHSFFKIDVVCIVIIHMK